MATLDVIVVFQREELCMSTQTSPSSEKALVVDLLQCQLLSLVGVAPDEQILLSSTLEVLYSPTKANIETITVDPRSRPRFFLFSSSQQPKIPELTGDWGQICTKSTFGDAAVMQPAFRKISGGEALDFLICGACAQTCTTNFQPVNPMEWTASKKLASRFISEVTVVAGEVDVAAPPGFTKLPGDLNFSASGDYVYLCVKRGGPRVLTQLHVLYRKPGVDSKVLNPEKIVDVDCNSGGAVGDGIGVNVRLGYDSVQYSGNTKQLDTLAITDIAVVVGNQKPPSSAYTKVTRNLNEGAPGARPVFLYYKLSPLGGFVCNSGREHSEFGECLFATRHLAGVDSFFYLDERRFTVAGHALTTQRHRADAAIMDAHYRQHQPGMLQRLQSGLKRAQSYENKKMQEEALKRIPVDKLHERARANSSPMPSYQDELVKQLLHWFKKEFFTWMNQPRCSACNHDKTRSVQTEGPKTPEEVAGQASRVEVYQCPACGAFTRFPRYNDPVKLLDTRTGRCGEWANCFTLCCRAMGFEARYVLDVTDHVWTEVYSEHYKRWLHCDSCEDQLDCPLTYEVGWGKKLSYIFSFAYDEVVDTARRYTQNWAEMCSRRRDVDEKWLDTTISQMNRTLWDQLPPERVAILVSRAKSERKELLRGRLAQSNEVKGRVSGSAEWKNQRKEDGKEGTEKISPQNSSKKVGRSLTQVPAAELLQEICRNMVVGCQPQNEHCTNPFCLAGRSTNSSLDVSSDVNERAAKAIQVVTALSACGFSSESLTMLRCARATELRPLLWNHKPLVYLPLQDPPSAKNDVPLIDISGHENHAKNSKWCALRKPFKIPNPGLSGDDNEAFGMELLAGQELMIPMSTASASTGYAFSFLVRLDKIAGDDNAKVCSVLNAEIGVLDPSDSVALCLSWDASEKHFIADLCTQDRTTRVVVSTLAFGHYAHIAVGKSSEAVVVYINGVAACQLPTTAATSVQTATIKGPAEDLSSFAVVVSQVAIIPGQSLQSLEEFCNIMAKEFVSAPPLKAFGPGGELRSERCTAMAAGAQSGYRVARVLMWGGDFFDGLQFVYEKINSAATTIHGDLIGNTSAKQRASSPTTTLELLPDEVITRVAGRKGAWTDCIRLDTNFGRSVTCGGKGGGDFSVPTSAQSEVRSVSFKTGDHLTDIAVFVLESSPTILHESDTMQKLQKTLSSCDSPSRQKAVSAAVRYLNNIAQQPEEAKFQRIRASNKFFASNVGVLGPEAAKTFMNWCGFEESREHGEQFFCFRTSVASPSPRRLVAEAFKRIHFLKQLGAQ